MVRSVFSLAPSIYIVMMGEIGLLQDIKPSWSVGVRPQDHDGPLDAGERWAPSWMGLDYIVVQFGADKDAAINTYLHH